MVSRDRIEHNAWSRVFLGAISVNICGVVSPDTGSHQDIKDTDSLLGPGFSYELIWMFSSTYMPTVASLPRIMFDCFRSSGHRVKKTSSLLCAVAHSSYRTLPATHASWWWIHLSQIHWTNTTNSMKLYFPQSGLLIVLPNKKMLC